MKIRQNVRHWASRKALRTPVVGDRVRSWLVDHHTRVFLDRADSDRREERRAHLDAFFDCTMDTYLTALDNGFSEARGREITHAQANFDFYNHGWTEMMEFPSDEVVQHYERYAEFFDRHGITIAAPLGDFRTAEIPSAPSTPERLDDPDHPHAAGGFADDVYVERPDGELVVGGGTEPTDVSVEDAPGVGNDASGDGEQRPTDGE